MHLSIFRVILVTLPLASAHLAYLERAASCPYASQAGYCCNGSIINPDHDNDLSPSKLVCCEGDNPSINLGTNSPSSCTAGSAVPLTQVSSIGSRQSTTSASASASASATATTDAGAGAGASTTASTDTSSSASTNGAGAGMATTVPMMGMVAAAGSLLFNL